ncbi:MAG: hypothetical protein ACKVT2_18890 [Saprospiraceae bacterium]
MKKILLLPLFLCLATLAFSQGKHEFGFVVKAGNYSLPFEKTELDVYSNNDTRTIYQKAGAVYSIGIWQSLPLGSRFRISAELLYRNALVKNGEHFSRTYFERGQAYQENKQKHQESSVSIPIKLHYRFKKDGKFSMALGGGVSRVFALNVFEENRIQFKPEPETTSTSTITFSDWDAFKTQFNLNAAIYYQLGSKTSLGLDYTFEKLAYQNGYYPKSQINQLIYCECLYTEPSIISNMNSFSVSLRHNILN